uniref:BTB domain-containing protein n=1 Tax=Mola mola TaxID=94237 RepID=A0A3Q3XJT3_MOLML
MEVSSHSLFLLQQLNVQREFGFLCDCTVAIGNVYFKAHRAVLAAFSNYFKMIFIHQSRSESSGRSPALRERRKNAAAGLRQTDTLTLAR